MSYMLASIGQKESLMSSISAGKYQELNVSYCDASNQQFRVFQTYDGSRFIYATPRNSTSSVGSIVPMKLIPIPHTPNKGTGFNNSNSISNNRNFNFDQMLQHQHGQGQMHSNVDQIYNLPHPNYSDNSSSHYKYNQNQNYCDSNANGTPSSLTYFGHCVNPELKRLGLKIMSPNSRSRSWGNNSHGNASESQSSSPSISSPIKIFGMHNYFVDYHASSSNGRPERQRDSGDGTSRAKNNDVKNIHQNNHCNNYNYNSFGGNHIVQNQNVRLQGPSSSSNQYANTENYNLQNSNVATYVLRPVLVHPMPQHELEDVEYLPYVSMPQDCVQPEHETAKYNNNNTSEDTVDPGLKTGANKTCRNFKSSSSSKPDQNGESQHQAKSEDPPMEFEFLATSCAETITEILTRPNTRSEAQNQEEVKNRLLHFLTSTTKKLSGSYADINTSKSKQYQKQNQQVTTQSPSTNSSHFTSPPSTTTKVTDTKSKPNANSVSELFRYPSRMPYEDPIPAPPASSTAGKLNPKSNFSNNKTHKPLQRPTTYNVHKAETPLKLKEKAKARSDITMPVLNSTHTNQSSLKLKGNWEPSLPKSPLKPISMYVPLPDETIKPATVGTGTLTDVSFDTNNNVICRNSYTIIASDSTDKGRSTSFSNCTNANRTANDSFRNLASSEIHVMDHHSEELHRPAEIQSVTDNVNNNFSCYFDWKQMCENESWSFFGNQSKAEIPAPADAELKLALASTKGHQTPPWLFDVNIDPDIIHAFNLYEEKYSNNWLLYPRLFFLHSNVGINPNQCQKLTKLSLPRVATDNLLDIIGKTTSHLKYLDVSGSPGVSNEGIQKLFFKSAKENTSLHTISSWMCKNKSKMNKVANTLDYLDFSYTKTNFCSRKLINLLPGSYVCQRSFRIGENDTFGHHIFLRRIPDLEQHLQTFEKASTFEIQLGVAAGLRGAVHFMKLVEHHAWRNCYLAIRDADKNRNIPVKIKRPIIGLITATKDEKRIFGEVYFEGGDLTKVYSLFPIEMNIIGEHCPSLRSLTAVLTNTFQRSNNKGHFLPHLTYLNTIADPETILSVLKNCPSLKYCRARVRDGTLTHSDIINCFQTSSGSTIRPCRKLQELWLVPSFMSPSRRRLVQRKERTGTGGIISHNNLHKTQTPSIITGDSVHLIDGIELQRPEQGEEAQVQHVSENEGIGILDSSLKLSAETARALFLKCPRLKRLGNMAWWYLVSKTDFEDLKAELGANGNDTEKTQIFIEWENILLPDLDLTSIYGPGSALGSS